MSSMKGKMSSLVIGVIFIFFGLGMIQPLAEYVNDLNTTVLITLTGGTAIVTLIEFLPFIFGAAVILGGIAILWRAASGT